MIVYTFRTFPLIKELKGMFDDVFVFSKLKEDLNKLNKKLLKEKPNYVLGIAVTKGPSRFEPQTINKFNNVAITSGEVDKLNLFVPTDLLGFEVSKRPTHTFCNWTMYQIQSYINQNKLKTKLIFSHVNPKDINKLLAFTKDL